jgi:glycerophosphoryl diester phosphodiesterase
MNTNRILSCFIAAAIGLSGAAASGQNPNNYKTSSIIFAMQHPSSDLTIVCAHRGVHATWGYDTYTSTPENSLSSIGNAASEGAECIEVDIRLTQDNIPILTHDSTWGRETNVGANWGTTYFNSWGVNPGLTVPDGDPGELGGGSTDDGSQEQAGLNPQVSAWSLNSVQTSGGGIKLRNSVNWEWASDSPPTLQNVIDYYNSHQLVQVLALDIKDTNALSYAWRTIAENKAWDGQPFSFHVFFKIDAGWNYKNGPSDFQNQFSSHLQVQYQNVAYLPDWQWMYIMPVLQTSSASQDQLDGVANVNANVELWKTFSRTVGVELDQKEPGGNLSQASSNWGNSTSLANFMPYAEWISPSDHYNTYLFFNSNGYCCSSLQKYLYPGGYDGGGVPIPADNTDQRYDWSFILYGATRFNLVTTDNVLPVLNSLSSAGMRNTGRMQ